jgi:ribosomal protein L44E
MSTLAPASITHWCRNCNAHHALQQVRRGVPAPTSLNGEVDVLICPSCNSYDIEELQEVSDAQ